MAGPYPPDYGAGAGPRMYPHTFPQQPYPPHPTAPYGPAAEPYPENPVVPSAYPGMLPPPVQYRKRRRWRVVAGTLLAIAVVAGVVAASVFVARNYNRDSAGPVTAAQAKTAIQGYLDALSRGDDETIARNTLCGLFDEVKDRRSDLEVANLNSDAFRKQFSQVEVTSIDKMVFLSTNQVQVLFTMRVVPATGPIRGQQRSNEEEQGVAQLLLLDNEILVCNYLLRAAGQY
jgi:hypothetical protein